MLLQSRLCTHHPLGPSNAHRTRPRSFPFPRILYHQGPFQTQARAEPRLSSPQTKPSTSTLTAAELVASAFLPADAVPTSSSSTFQQHPQHHASQHAPLQSPEPPPAPHEPGRVHAEVHQELRLIEQAIHTMRQPRAQAGPREPTPAMPAPPPATRAPWALRMDAALTDSMRPEAAGRWLHLTIAAGAEAAAVLEPAGISFMAGSPSGSTPSHPQPPPPTLPDAPGPSPASPFTKFIARHGAALAAAAVLSLSLPFLPLHLLPTKLAALATLLTGVVVAGGAVAAAAGCAIGAAAAAAALLFLSTEAVVRAALGSRAVSRLARPVAPTPKDLVEAVASLCQGRPIGSPRARPPGAAGEAQAEERRSWQGAGGLHAGAQHGMAHWEVHGEAHEGVHEPAEAAAAGVAGTAAPELPGHVLEELARVRRAAAERAARLHRAAGLPCPPDHAVAAAGAGAPGGGEAGPAGPEPGGPLAGSGPGALGQQHEAAGGVLSNVLPAGQLPSHSRARQQSQQRQ